MKTILYRLFGVGRIPEPEKARLQQEGGLLCDEGLRCSLANPYLRTPTKIRHGFRRWFTGAVALTNLRLMGFEYSRRCINVPFTDERFRKMRFAQEGDDTLVVEFDPAMFQPDWTGLMIFRFRTPHAPQLLQRLQERLTAPVTPPPLLSPQTSTQLLSYVA
jgi:hypothetical protein